MKITVEHEIPCDPTEESRCVYSGDFWGKEVCQYHKRRDRAHGRKAPVERRLPRCTLFDEWLPGEYVKCEACRKAIEAARKALREKAERENPKPLTLEELREMGGKPYWHQSLTCDTKASSKWMILPENIAKYADNYDYGINWLAYRERPEGRGEE